MVSHNLSAAADPASASAVMALEGDPFYRSIMKDFDADPVRRRSVLADYFAFSIEEGRKHGRCVHLDDPTQGVAVWLLPKHSDSPVQIADRKRRKLAHILGPIGLENYCRIIDYMHSRSKRVVPADSWYLSIVAINPAQQGRGLGRLLLAPTLSEAERCGVACFLETFSPQALRFYQRLGFQERAKYTEPTTRAEYAVMVRAGASS